MTGVNMIAKFEGEAGSKFDALVDEYLAAKAAEKAAKDRKAEFEKEIREMMGDADTAYVGEKLRATIATRNRSNIDRKKLEAEYEEALHACLTNTIYTQLDAKA